MDINQPRPSVNDIIADFFIKSSDLGADFTLLAKECEARGGVMREQAEKIEAMEKTIQSQATLIAELEAKKKPRVDAG